MKGFTLIETIVYMALLGLIMTGALLTSYELIMSTSRSAGKTTVQEEGTFVERKISWALADMSAAPLIGGSGCAQTLSVAKTGYAKNPIEFQRDAANNKIQMREGGTGLYSDITTINVSAGCLKFASITAVGSAPPGIIATTTIAGLDFVNTAYVRK